MESVATLWSITQDTDLYQQGIENSSHNMCPLWLAVCGEEVRQQYNQMEIALTLRVEDKLTDPPIRDILEKAVYTSRVWFSLHAAFLKNAIAMEFKIFGFKTDTVITKTWGRFSTLCYRICFRVPVLEEFK